MITGAGSLARRYLIYVSSGLLAVEGNNDFY
jgi:hypothetical protein